MHRHQGQAHRYHFCCTKVQPVHSIDKMSLLQVKGPTFVPCCHRDAAPGGKECCQCCQCGCVCTRGFFWQQSQLCLSTPPGDGGGSSSQLAELCPSSLGVHTEQNSLFLSNYCFEGSHPHKGRLMFRKQF